MNKYSLVFFAILFLNGFLSEPSNAQVQMVIALNNNTVETFPISAIRSIKFPGNTMTLVENSGTINTWAISDIIQYSFSQTTEVEPSIVQNRNVIDVFPNPSADHINILFSNDNNQNVLIGLFDSSGKLLRNIHEGTLDQGMHKFETKVDFLPGVYYCKIVMGSKFICKPLVIN